MKHSSKRILITGVSGFLGTALRDALIDESCTVLGTSTQGSQCSIRPCFEWELTRPHRIESILEAAEPDQVIHLASPVDPRRDPSLIDSMNQAIVEGGKVLSHKVSSTGGWENKVERTLGTLDITGTSTAISVTARKAQPLGLMYLYGLKLIPAGNGEAGAEPAPPPEPAPGLRHG